MMNSIRPRRSSLQTWFARSPIPKVLKLQIVRHDTEDIVVTAFRQRLTEALVAKRSIAKPRDGRTAQDTVGNSLDHLQFESACEVIDDMQRVALLSKSIDGHDDGGCRANDLMNPQRQQLVASHPPLQSRRSIRASRAPPQAWNPGGPSSQSWRAANPSRTPGWLL